MSSQFSDTMKLMFLGQWRWKRTTLHVIPGLPGSCLRAVQRHWAVKPFTLRLILKMFESFITSHFIFSAEVICFFLIRNHNFCEWIGLNFDVRLGKREHAELFSSDRSFYMKIVLYFLRPWRCFMACGLSYKTSSWFWKQTWIWLFFLPPVWSESVVF